MPEHPPSNETNLSLLPALREGSQLASDELNRSPQTGFSVRMDYAFPEQFVDNLSRQEVFNKHLFRPNTYLHKWWARRCGTTFRTILKQFAPQDALTDYYTPGGLAGQVILDPMMGGGTTLHEAIRLGANVIGADIDPIPIIQTRASLTEAELKDLRDTFRHFSTALYDSLGHYFETECPTCDQATNIRYSLHGIRKQCACRDVVQIDQYDLRHEGDRKIRVNPHSWEISESQHSDERVPENPGLITKADKQCPACGHKYAELLDLPFYSRYVPVAIVAVCGKHGTFLRSPSERDLARLKQADEQRGQLDFGPVEDFRVNNGPKSGDLLRHNVRSYLDTFSSRQLLYLNCAIQQLRNYTGINKLILGTLVSTSLEFNSMLCGYKGWYKRRPGAIRHVFALHAYSFQYTALENNPVNPQRSSGNLQQLFHDRIERGREWAAAPVERRIDGNGARKLVKIPGEMDSGVEVFRQSELADGQRRFWLIQGDSRSLPLADHSIDIIVTDPPYYDSVQYSDLGAFFRVWLTRLLPEAAEWNYDETRVAVAAKTADRAGNFAAGIADIFGECNRVLKRNSGRMVFTFHHWEPNAWAELTLALKTAGFRLMNAYVVYSEHPISVHIRGLKSIRHDSVLVLALASEELPVAWESVEEIDTGDSETFCRRCGATLGWLLDSDLSPSEIRATWETLIKGNSNDR